MSPVAARLPRDSLYYRPLGGTYHKDEAPPGEKCCQMHCVARRDVLLDGVHRRADVLVSGMPY